MGRMKSVIGTRSFSRNKAMSLSKLEKLNGCEIALKTKRVSGRVLSLHRSCSPNVTLIMNHMNLKIRTKRKSHTHKPIDNFRYIGSLLVIHVRIRTKIK